MTVVCVCVGEACGVAVHRPARRTASPEFPTEEEDAGSVRTHFPVPVCGQHSQGSVPAQ